MRSIGCNRYNGLSSIEQEREISVQELVEVSRGSCGAKAALSFRLISEESKNNGPEPNQHPETVITNYLTNLLTLEECLV